jgi:hypothetical protein
VGPHHHHGCRCDGAHGRAVRISRPLTRNEKAPGTFAVPGALLSRRSVLRRGRAGAAIRKASEKQEFSSSPGR